MNKKNHKRAFTLTELIIVISVIAILAAVMIPSLIGYIKKARISNDQITVGQLNSLIQLKNLDEENINYDTINEIYQESYGKSLTELEPASAQYGYHFWYEETSKKVVLLTTNELQEKVNGRQNLSTTNNQKTLREQLFDGYILLDGKGSELANVLTNLESLKDEQTYLTLIENVLKIKDDKYDFAIYNTIYSFLSNTAIINNWGTFRFANNIDDANFVDDIYFIPGITEITANLLEYDGETINKKQISEVNTTIFEGNNKTFVLPKSVKNIFTFALYFPNGGMNYTIQVPKDLVLEGLFSPNSTNANIVYGEEEYNIDEIESEAQNKIIAFEISINEYSTTNNVINIELSRIRNKSLTLIADNFQADGPSYSTKVEYQLIDFPNEVDPTHVLKNNLIYITHSGEYKFQATSLDSNDIKSNQLTIRVNSVESVDVSIENSNKITSIAFDANNTYSVAVNTSIDNEYIFYVNPIFIFDDFSTEANYILEVVTGDAVVIDNNVLILPNSGEVIVKLIFDEYQDIVRTFVFSCVSKIFAY